MPEDLPKMIDAHRAMCVEVQRQDGTRDLSLGTPGEQHRHQFLPSLRRVFMIVDSPV